MESDERKIKMWNSASPEQKESFWAILDNIHKEQQAFDNNELNSLNYE